MARFLELCRSRDTRARHEASIILSGCMGAA